MTPTPNPPALLPCPFCGGKANGDGIARYSPPLTNTWWNDGSKITEAFFVNCMSCGIRNGSGLGVGYQTREKAHEHWNTRQSLAEPKVSREADLREAIRKAKRAADEKYGIAWLHLEEISRFELVLAELSDPRADWACSARKQSLPEPADCGWPSCGCDPYAMKVIDALEESGALSNPPADGDGWREISSADPKQDVLLYFPATVRGHRENANPAMTKVGTVNDFPFRPPSHWMPLPSAPLGAARQR